MFISQWQLTYPELETAVSAIHFDNVVVRCILKVIFRLKTAYGPNYQMKLYF